MSGAPLLPVADALAAILGSARSPSEIDIEIVALRQAAGRTLARDLAARRTQPPCPVSAMDGYAVRAADLSRIPATLDLIGESAAGRAFDGMLGAREAVRIFTGAPMPKGADTVLMQENAQAEAGRVTALQAEPLGRHVRGGGAGQDFREGEVLLAAGLRLGASDVALAAAMDHPDVPVFRRPRVAVLATGDELALPGEARGPDAIVASNSFALMALAEAAGAEVIDLGIARDDLGSLAASIAAARDAAADVLVTLGGASVGDHDLVQRALVVAGMEIGFWRIAMRPGKPLLHGHIETMQVLGLPGNPVSAIVCGLLFVRPLVRALAGDRDPGADPSEPAVLGAPMAANDGRQDYVRSKIVREAVGLPSVIPGPRQDSSLLKALSDADGLVIRPPNAQASSAGEPCRVIGLSRFGV